MSLPARLAVFVSGGGTNLQALLDRFHAMASPPAQVELVVASRAGIRALDRAEAAGVSSMVIDPALDEPLLAAQLLQALEAKSIDLIVLAGYVKRVPTAVVERFRHRLLNIHPALLPAFGGAGMYGPRVHQAVLASGARVTGATVHLVDEEYDTGPIVAQWPVPVLPHDTPDTLAARVLRVEHLLLPAAIEAMVRGASAPPLPPELAFELVHAVAPDETPVDTVAMTPTAAPRSDNG